MPHPLDLPQWQVTGTSRDAEAQPIVARLPAADATNAQRVAEQRFNMNIEHVQLVDPSSTAGDAANICLILGSVVIVISLIAIAIDPALGTFVGYVASLLFATGLVFLLTHGLHRVARSINRLRETLDENIRT